MIKYNKLIKPTSVIMHAGKNILIILIRFCHLVFLLHQNFHQICYYLKIIQIAMKFNKIPTELYIQSMLYSI